MRKQFGSIAGLGFFLALLVAILGGAVATAHPTQVGGFGSAGSGSGQLASPGGIAVDQATGNVFVADTGNNRVSEFTAEGTHIRTWGWGVSTGAETLEVCANACGPGIEGSGNGQFDEVIGVSISPVNGHVLTLSRGDGRVQEFTENGEFVRSFGGLDENDPAKFAAVNLGNDIAVDSKGNVYVSNRGPNFVSRVSVFDSTGIFRRQVTGQASFRPFFEPLGLAIDSRDNLYIVDSTLSNEVEKVKEFGPDGVFIRTLATAPTSAVGGITVDPSDDHVFVTVGDEADGSYVLREYDATGSLIETTSLSGTSPFSASGASFGLAFGAAATLPGSAPGVFYFSDREAAQVLTFGQPAAGPPTLEGVGAGGIGATFADIVGQVNANGADTTYRVEYGETNAYGLSAPAVPLGIGSTYDPKRASAHLTGLKPGTVYHYSLLAVNALGATRSEDAVFATVAPSDGSEVTLPDGRAYEMVSPVDKLSNDISFAREASQTAAPSGNAVTYSTFNGIPGAEAGAFPSYSVGRRTTQGWVSEPLSTPSTNQFGGAQPGYPVMVSSDLSQSLFQDNLDLSGGEADPTNTLRKLFLRTGSPRSYRLLTPYKPAVQTNFFAIGSSEDFSHLFFETGSPVTPDVPVPPSGRLNDVYEWFNGHLRPVGILPGRTDPDPGGASAYPKDFPNGVSRDGSRVIFKAPASTDAFDLYMRIDATRTVKITASRTSSPQPAGVKYLVGAGADGSVVYFTSSERLTDNASPFGNDLYRFEVATEKLIDLTPNSEEPFGANVYQEGLVSDDGSTVYFTATGALAPGAEAEHQNLYRWNERTGLDYIDRLIPGYDTLSYEKGEVNADGSVLIFNSRAFLPGTFDTGESINPVSEIFRYSAIDDQIACVSCTRPGVRPTGGAANFSEPSDRRPRQNGGRVFFETTDALVPQDVNGVSDVYEWEGGKQYLISGGRGPYRSVLSNSSRSGDDVFFLTRDRLLPRDVDDNIDLYDARVGGGFPEPVGAISCSESACRQPGAAPPGLPATSSAHFSGRGNERHKARRCRAKARKAKAKGKKVTRCVKKHRKRKRHSSGKHR